MCHPVFLHLVNLEHVGDVWHDVHVVAEEADVVDAVIADRVAAAPAHPDPRPGPRLEERGESVGERETIAWLIKDIMFFTQPRRHLLVQLFDREILIKVTVFLIDNQYDKMYFQRYFYWRTLVGRGRALHCGLWTCGTFCEMTSVVICT